MSKTDEFLYWCP